MASLKDFPGVHNTPTGIEATWIFYGVRCSPAQAAIWRTAMDQGHCPWCGKGVSARYGNMVKHMRACTSRPLPKEVSK